jgi:hypothetical protein
MRVVRSSVMVAGAPLDVESWYKVATCEYLFTGRDG